LEYRVWDVGGHCWIPETEVAVTADGTVLTYEEQGDRWAKEVVPVKILWSTGLRDKGGKRIFEGDIFDRDTGSPGNVLPITLLSAHGQRFMFGADQFSRSDALNGVVVGNIYEDPDLLYDRLTQVKHFEVTRGSNSTKICGALPGGSDSGTKPREQRLYTCLVCGKKEYWNDDWRRYSSIAHDEACPHDVPVACSEKCMVEVMIKIKSGAWKLPMLAVDAGGFRVSHKQTGYVSAKGKTD